MLEQIALVAAIASPVLTGIIAFATSQAGTRAAVESLQIQIDDAKADAVRAHERIDQIHSARRAMT
jgi:hypothetical protein